MVTIEEFRRLELRVAQVLEAKPHPNADRLLILTIDVGGVRKEVVAGISLEYTPSELVGKQVVTVDNLEPATLRGVQSHGMILAAKEEGKPLSLLTLDRPVAPGSPVR